MWKKYTILQYCLHEKFVTKSFGKEDISKTQMAEKQCHKNNCEINFAIGINEEEETIPYVLPICKDAQLKTFELTKETFYKSVEVAKRALQKAKEIDKEIIHKVRRTLDEEYGPNLIQDLLIMIATLEIAES